MMNVKLALNETRNLLRDPATNGLFHILIRADGLELTDELKEAISRKIGRVRQYAPRASRARVQVQRERLRASAAQFRVSVQYDIPGRILVAEHRAPEPLEALDLVSEKIERRLRKRKTAQLASRLARRGRRCRIADFCGVHEPTPLERRR